MSRPDDAAIRAAHRAGWEAAMNTLNPSQRAPYPGGMPPTRHGVRAPLPTAVRTMADLAQAMTELRGWAGAPTLRELGERAPGLRKSTLHGALNGAHFMKSDVLHAFVKACGAEDDWRAWFHAWQTAKETQRREKAA